MAAYYAELLKPLKNVVVPITKSDRTHVFQTYAVRVPNRDKVVEAMKADSGLELPALRVDGGAVSNDFLMQFQADILGVPVQRPAVTETTALGAAYLAGLATGYWDSLEEIQKQWRVEATFEPKMREDQREMLYAGWKRAVTRAQAWIEDRES